MKIGRLSVMIEEHKTLGKIFVIRAINTDDLGDIFDATGDHMVLRVTKDTAILLSQYIDETIEEDFLNENETRSTVDN